MSGQIGRMTEQAVPIGAGEGIADVTRHDRLPAPASGGREMLLRFDRVDR